MNWITTNLRLPEDLYMQLKLYAAKERKSVAAVIRQKLTENSSVQRKNMSQLIMKMRAFGERMAKKNKGINLSKELIKMRYEQ